MIRNTIPLLAIRYVFFFPGEKVLIPRYKWLNKFLEKKIKRWLFKNHQLTCKKLFLRCLSIDHQPEWFLIFSEMPSDDQQQLMRNCIIHQEKVYEYKEINGIPSVERKKLTWDYTKAQQE